MVDSKLVDDSIEVPLGWRLNSALGIIAVQEFSSTKLSRSVGDRKPLVVDLEVCRRVLDRFGDLSVIDVELRYVSFEREVWKLIELG